MFRGISGAKLLTVEAVAVAYPHPTHQSRRGLHTKKWVSVQGWHLSGGWQEQRGAKCPVQERQTRCLLRWLRYTPRQPAARGIEFPSTQGMAARFPVQGHAGAEPLQLGG